MNRIEVYKGNTMSFKVQLEKDKTHQPFKNGDKVIFTLFRSNKRDKHILKKEVTEFIEGVAYVDLTPQDTNLEYGVYHYNVRYIENDIHIYDIVKGVFHIKGGVPYEQ